MNRILKCTVLLLLAASVTAATSSGLPFIHDDYAKALAEAKDKKLPIFVDCWAPW